MSESRIDVLLLAPHSHLGEQKNKGDVINVTVQQSNWLIERGIAKVQPTNKTDKQVKL